MSNAKSGDSYRSGCRKPDPTPEEIAAECARIREENYERDRQGKGNYTSGGLPRICDPIRVHLPSR